jgi:hypothetical protein
MLMLCPICAGEFQLRVALCPSCECDLVPMTLDQKAARTIESGEREAVRFVELCRPRLYPVAMLIKQMLQGNDIAVLVQGGHSLSVMPHLAFGGELRVMVDSRQLEFARSLYEAYFESKDGGEFAAEE